MDVLNSLGILAGSSWESGVNLYLTIASVLEDISVGGILFLIMGHPVITIILVIFFSALSVVFKKNIQIYESGIPPFQPADYNRKATLLLKRGLMKACLKWSFSCLNKKMMIG